MNSSLAIAHWKQPIAGRFVPICRRILIIGGMALAATIPTFAQNAELQQKLAAVKQVIALNKQSLQQYQWTETTQLNLNGDPKPPTQNMCQYGPGGQVQKTPIGPPPEQPSGGRLKQRVIEKKKEDAGLHGGSKGPPQHVRTA
jgi:hypothetical protein